MAADQPASNNQAEENAISRVLRVTARYTPELLVGAALALGLATVVLPATGPLALPAWAAALGSLAGGEALGILYGLIRDLRGGQKLSDE